MPSIFFDESGHTGENLLDPAQPTFVIASSRIGDRDAARILSDAFPRFKGQELKFLNVWRRYRQRLVPFCAALGERAEDLFVWHIDKKFCVLVKMIDFLIEPLANEAGHDFYRNAYAFKYANSIKFGLTEIGSAELYEATVAAYFEFAREPDDRALEQLLYRLQLFESSGPEEMQFFFRTARLGAERLRRRGSARSLRGTMEIYVTSMLSCVGYWSQSATEELDLFYDPSNSFFAQRALWEALTSKTVPEQWHPVSNGPPIKFPLPVRMTTPLESKSSAAIQLCDLLAGLSAKLRNRRDREGQDVIDAVVTTKVGEISINGIEPGWDFPGGGPELRDGPDPVDRMASIICGTDGPTD